MNVKISIVLKSFETPKATQEGPNAQRGPLKKNACGPSRSDHKVGPNTKKPLPEMRLGSNPTEVTKNSSVLSIRLPLKQSLYTVLRSPHIDKKSREQFEMNVHKQLIIIKTETKQLRDKLFDLKFHEMSGVQMKVIFHYKTRLNSLI